MGRIATLDCFEYEYEYRDAEYEYRDAEYEYRDAEYEYEKKNDGLPRIDARVLLTFIIRGLRWHRCRSSTSYSTIAQRISSYSYSVKRYSVKRYSYSMAV
jgi:hypothetical protein